jgi:hypothetical protein
MTSKRIRQLGRPLPARRSLLACRAFAAPEQLLFATDTVALTQINRSRSGTSPAGIGQPELARSAGGVQHAALSAVSHPGTLPVAPRMCSTMAIAGRSDICATESATGGDYREMAAMDQRNRLDILLVHGLS